MTSDNQSLTFDLGCALLAGLSVAGALLVIRLRQRQRERAAHANGHALGTINGATIYAKSRGDRTYRLSEED